MQITMDRYEADWAMVERGWHTHVLADAPAVRVGDRGDRDAARRARPASSIRTCRRSSSRPPRRCADGDAFVMFNFRGDRAIEISRAFDDAELDTFDRVRRPDVLYAGMMEYDGDLHIPKHYLVSPPEIERPMGELLAAAHVSQLAISETQKYGHVTYFWNGNRSGMFDERHRDLHRDPVATGVPFEQRPWMKAAEITDRLIAELRTGKHRFARVNYANGDMVGHTGSFDATVVAVETVDLQLARLARVVDELQGILVVTADHGNADEMFQRDKAGRVLRDKKTGQPVVKTSHTLNPVPFLIHDPMRGDRYEIDPARAADRRHRQRHRHLPRASRLRSAR